MTENNTPSTTDDDQRRKKGRIARFFSRDKDSQSNDKPESIDEAKPVDELPVDELPVDELPADKLSGKESSVSELTTNDVIIESVSADESTPAKTIEDGLDKSRSSFFSKITHVFKGSFDLDDELFEELEETLITSDIGVQASLQLVEKLRARVKSEKIQDAKGVIQGLRTEIADMLDQAEEPWKLHAKPHVVLMVGVNGAGKTTTTAKLAKLLQDNGKSVMLAAADTFRAAAVEQLQEWGQRLSIPVIAQSHGADAAAVAHDALVSARSRGVDVLMIDTAGRLHTQSDLMEQLQKVTRVLQKIDPESPHEVMLILDAGIGQNALTQLEHFKNAVGVSSLCLSKLDGSAKGGVALSLTEKFGLPIRFIGVGEGFSDLRPFNAVEFANALIPELDK